VAAWSTLEPIFSSFFKIQYLKSSTENIIALFLEVLALNHEGKEPKNHCLF
jgi:hypothetical protein